MKIWQHYIERYRDGYIDEEWLAAGEISSIDESNADAILGQLPAKEISLVRSYVDTYRQGHTVCFGGACEPEPSQVNLIRDWFANHDGRAEQ